MKELVEGDVSGHIASPHHHGTSPSHSLSIVICVVHIDVCIMCMHNVCIYKSMIYVCRQCELWKSAIGGPLGIPFFWNSITHTAEKNTSETATQTFLL